MSELHNLRTHLHTKDGDKILCVGATVPEGLEGEIERVATFNEASRTSYNIIISENQLNNLYNIKKHFATVRNLIKGSGFYVLSDRIAGECDAWINVLLTSLDPAHVRAPNVAEVVAAAADGFELSEYIRFHKVMDYPLPSGVELELVNRQLDHMPSSVKEYLQPHINGNTLSFVNCRAIFVWQT